MTYCEVEEYLTVGKIITLYHIRAVSNVIHSMIVFGSVDMNANLTKTGRKCVEC